jgi:hypothetical protein
MTLPNVSTVRVSSHAQNTAGFSIAGGAGYGDAGDEDLAAGGEGGGRGGVEVGDMDGRQEYFADVMVVDLIGVVDARPRIVAAGDHPAGALPVG